jgi:hypothetical protein
MVILPLLKINMGTAELTLLYDGSIFTEVYGFVLVLHYKEESTVL